MRAANSRNDNVFSLKFSLNVLDIFFTFKVLHRKSRIGDKPALEDKAIIPLNMSQLDIGAGEGRWHWLPAIFPTLRFL